MIQRKYANIKIKGEGNIGVLDLGEIDYKEGETANGTTLKERAEPKLVDALQRHFDCQVRIIYPHIFSTTPISIRVDVIICSSDEDHQEEVMLEETWLY